MPGSRELGGKTEGNAVIGLRLCPACSRCGKATAQDGEWPGDDGAVICLECWEHQTDVTFWKIWNRAADAVKQRRSAKDAEVETVSKSEHTHGTGDEFRPLNVKRCPKKGEWLKDERGCIVQALADFEFEEYEIYERVERKPGSAAERGGKRDD